MMENGHPGVEIDEAAIRRGENPYTKYYQQQGEYNPVVTGTAAAGAGPNGPGGSTPHGATVVVP